MLITPDKDPMGQAIADYYYQRRMPKLWVSTQVTTTDELPVKYLFRSWDKMPEIEQTALNLSKGKILDVGAAAGAHALCLQELSKTVKAIDNSLLSVEVMQKRGVLDVEAADFFELEGQSFDTILLLMNGAGICGTIDNLPVFFTQCRKLLNPGGQVLLDSSDLIYLYGDEEEGFDIDLSGAYYGELMYTVKYRKLKSEPFPWLFVDFDTLQANAAENGFKCQKILDGPHYDFLARLTLISI
jgi:cyclopropane fatty-acyl-phospholipid synthase-like methyltransferase